MLQQFLQHGQDLLKEKECTFIVHHFTKIFLNNPGLKSQTRFNFIWWLFKTRKCLVITSSMQTELFLCPHSSTWKVCSKDLLKKKKTDEFILRTKIYLAPWDARYFWHVNKVIIIIIITLEILLTTGVSYGAGTLAYLPSKVSFSWQCQN